MYLIYLKNRNPHQAVFSYLSFLLFFLTVTLFPFVKVNAQGDLLVIPKRVLFEGSKKTQELNLANTGKDTATFEISFIQIRMNEYGKFENITQPDSGQAFAEPFVRFYPRRVTLAPNEAQAVKLQLAKSNSLPEGEYRSHLYFRSIPKKQQLLGTREELAKDSGISVKITAVFGITVPVIIQVGNLTSTVEISDLSLMEEESDPKLKITLIRSGNKSVYGDLTINHISSTGKENQVGFIKGIAVYTPTPVRQSVFSLEKKSGIDYHSGKLIVTYTDQSSKHVEIAKRELVLK